MEERHPNRMIFPVLGILMNLCMGNLYAWSVFRIPLQKAYGWTAAEATVPFQLSIAFFAIAMVIAGRWQDKAGPRKVGMIGGALVGAGFILSSFLGSTLMGLYISFGVITGLGIGFAYVTPLSVTIKWWPDKRGLMTGLVVLGFGAGAIIGGIGGPLLVQSVGVLTTFLIFGIVFGAVITGCAALLKNPPAGYKPAGWSPPVPAAGTVAAKTDFTTGEMMATPQFYLLWLCYFIGSAVGLTLISQASPIGQEMAGLSPVVAGGALVALSVFNGLGRPGFGAISDAIGRKNAVIADFALLIVAMIVVLPNATSFGMYALGVCMVGFGFGGFLALMPAFTADFWGTKNLGLNYGAVFSAWGFAGVFGPILGLKVRAATGAWMQTFYILAGLCVLGIVLMVLTKAPKKVESMGTEQASPSR
jgi:MFS transporter, OFA family, oxalate/formate antiporter